MLIGKSLPTAFAPPERLSQDAMLEQYNIITKVPRLQELLDCMPDLVLVLNKHRQIVFANKILLNFLHKNDCKKIIGLRPGEMLGCIHAGKNKGGCGTTEFCRECGAVKAILASLVQQSQMQECSIQSVTKNRSYNFRVWTSPHWYEDNLFVFFVIRDITEEKFKSALERTFFHDIINTASGLYGILSLIDNEENFKQYSSLLSGMSYELIEEINSQRDIIKAEEGEIDINKEVINGLESIKKSVEFYKNQLTAQNIPIVISEDSEEVWFPSDGCLIRRVIGNMIKNALEASNAGQTIIVSCKRNDDKVIFSVHNPKCMPKDIQLNIFKRSFSTKGEGRGWGTYSMKLLSEKYLQGKISFTSTPEDGTTFYAEYPIADASDTSEKDTAENTEQSQNTKKV